jgi:hypothetical protein
MMKKQEKEFQHKISALKESLHLLTTEVLTALKLFQ